MRLALIFIALYLLGGSLAAQYAYQENLLLSSGLDEQEVAFHWIDECNQLWIQTSNLKLYRYDGEEFEDMTERWNLPHTYFTEINCHKEKYWISSGLGNKREIIYVQSDSAQRREFNNSRALPIFVSDFAIYVKTDSLVHRMDHDLDSTYRSWSINPKEEDLYASYPSMFDTSQLFSRPLKTPNHKAVISASKSLYFL